MDIKTYIDPTDLLDYIIKKTNEVQGEMMLHNAIASGPTPSLYELPDATYAAGKMNGRIEAASEIINDLIKMVKK